jgi:uncharacterized membrane protein
MNTRTKITALVKVVLTVVILIASGGSIFAQNAGLNVRKPVIADRDLVIQIADITENALFYPMDIDGVRMEVLAVRAPDGVIRTAFNTCQVCYNSGRGYFVQEGTVLICQNCGRRYRMSQVERQAGGCNPVPIFPANKTVNDSTITISQEFLKQAKAIFASWKRG